MQNGSPLPRIQARGFRHYTTIDFSSAFCCRNTGAVVEIIFNLNYTGDILMVRVNHQQNFNKRILAQKETEAV
jgi:hypothetical protein